MRRETSQESPSSLPRGQNKLNIVSPTQKQMLDLSVTHCGNTSEELGQDRGRVAFEKALQVQKVLLISSMMMSLQ